AVRMLGVRRLVGDPYGDVNQCGREHVQTGVGRLGENAEAAAPEPHSELERRQKQRRKDRAGSRSLLPGLASRHVCSGRTLYHHRCTPMQSFSQVSRPAKRGCDVIIREVPHHLAGGIHAVSKRTLAFLTTLMILGSARLSFAQNEAAEADSGSQVVMIV